MARKVRWTASASDDVRIAAEFIERDSYIYAVIFVRRILEAVESLQELSERGRRVPEWEDSNVREIYVMNHRVIYAVSPEVVNVLAIIYGPRNLSSRNPRRKQTPNR